MQLVGRLAGRPLWAKGGRRPGEVEESSPPVGKALKCEPPPLTPEPGTPRRRVELCPLESWLMDCSPPPAAWELLPPQGEELEE